MDGEVIDLAAVPDHAWLFADVVVTALAAERELRPFVGELAPDPMLSRGWGAWLEIPHPSLILRQRSERGFHRLGELYDQMLDKNWGLAGLWEKRLKAVLALPHQVRPADSSPLAQQTADFVRTVMAAVPLPVANLQHNLGAILKGVAITEVMWEQIARGPLSGAWVPVDLIDRPMWRFGWGLDRKLHVMAGVGGRFAPFEAPPYKLMALTYGSKDTPWGRALLDRLYWPYYLKKHASKYWALFVERFAQPLMKGTYPYKAGQETANKKAQSDLLAVMETIRTGSQIALPSGLDVAFLEASRGGDSSYSAFVSWLDRAEALLLLGEVDTSGLAKGTGSFAKSQISNDVRLETVEHDAALLGPWETATIYRWLVELNYGPDAPVPLSVYDSTDAADRVQRMEGIQNTLAAGLPVPKAYFYMTQQVPMPRDGEEIVEAPAAPIIPPPPNPADPLFRGPSAAYLAGARADLGAKDLARLGRVVEARDAQLQSVADHFVPLTTAYFAAQQQRLIGLLDSAPGAELDRLVAGDTPAHLVDWLTTAQIHAAGFGLLHTQEDVGSLRLAGVEDWVQALTPATATDFWAALLQISKDFFLTLTDQARRIAFAVAGLQEGPLLVDLHNILQQAQGGGLDRAAVVDRIGQAYEAHGVTPTSGWHAQLVYANNTRAAASAVRYQQTVGNPAAQRLLPYLMWWTIGDDRVRERPDHNHAVMNGRVFAINHPIWQTWWTPAGHNCRCGIATINLAEARRRGYTGSEPTGAWPSAPGSGGLALPDPGFGGAPDLSQAADDLTAKTQDIYDRAEAEGGDLLDAISRLFAALGLRRNP